MSSPLKYKVYDADGDMVASLRFAEDAAAVASLTSDSTVKVNGRIVWREGREAFDSADNYDNAANVIIERERKHHQESYERLRQGREQFAASRAYSSTLGMVSIPESD